MKKEVLLNSTAIDSPAWLYETVRQSLWLLKTNRDISKVKVCLHPVQILPTPLSIINLIKNKPLWLISKFVKAIFGSARKCMASFGSSQLDPNRSSSFYERVCSGSIGLIETEYGKIEFSRFKKIIKLGILDSVKLDSKALCILSCLKLKGEMVPQRFLQLNYKGVLIGDLVASTALRTCDNAAGRIDNCSNLFLLLVRAIAVSDYFAGFMSSTSGIEAYVSAPEPTYIHSIYTRLGHRLGASIIELHTYNNEFSLILPGSSKMNPKVVHKIDPNELTPAQISEVNRYMYDRLYAKKSPLWYMVNGVNEPGITVITNSEGNKINLSESDFVAVVFLHSFDDGQYYHGLDGFDDLYHWTTSTLDALISNPLMSKVLIKPHPNANYNEYKADRLAVENLASIYQHHKIHWLNSKISVPLLSEINNLIGITHHGSVAEELAYLGVPVIGCGIASPWMNNFDFVRVWNTPTEYIKILHNLDESCFIKTSMDSSQSLYQYINAYRIEAKSPLKNRSWLIYAGLVSDDTPEISLANHRKVESDLRRLHQGDAIFAKLIKKIACCLC